MEGWSRLVMIPALHAGGHGFKSHPLHISNDKYRNTLTSFVLDPVKAYDYVFEKIRMKNFTGIIYNPGIESTKNSTIDDGILYIASFHGFQKKIPKEIQDIFFQLIQDIRNKKLLFFDDFFTVYSKSAQQSQFILLLHTSAYMVNS